MRVFHVTIRSAEPPTAYITLAHSASEAYEQAAAQYADIPCGITVMPRQVA